MTEPIKEIPMDEKLEEVRIASQSPIQEEKSLFNTNLKELFVMDKTGIADTLINALNAKILVPKWVELTEKGQKPKMGIRGNTEINPFAGEDIQIIVNKLKEIIKSF